jgi:hypothetical protein
MLVHAVKKAGQRRPMGRWQLQQDKLACASTS